MDTLVAVVGESREEKANRIVARAVTIQKERGSKNIDVVKGKEGFHLSCDVPMGDELSPVGAYMLYDDIL